MRVPWIRWFRCAHIGTKSDILRWILWLYISKAAKFLSTPYTLTTAAAGTLCHRSTPLQWAALEGHSDVAALLIEKGADVAVKNDDG